jgi:hypothetical protein
MSMFGRHLFQAYFFQLYIKLFIMKNLVVIALLIAIASLESQAQNETTTKSQAKKDTTATVDLLGDLNQTSQEKTKLLPDKFIFTQRILWGEKGLMRSFNAFELTPEKRQHELKVRRTMLVTHQIMGMLTLGGMVAQGIVGAKLYNYSGNNYQGLKHTHEAIATGVNIGYFSTAALSLFAPPKMLNERKGYSSIKLHRGLAIIHFSAMVATNVLATMMDGSSSQDLKSIHRACAFTAFGAFAASMIVIKF